MERGAMARADKVWHGTGKKVLCAAGIILVACALMSSLDANNAEESSQPHYQKADKRDPFIPYVTSDGQLINIGAPDKEFAFKLEGIIYDKDGKSMAIINGEVLKADDTIADIKIVEIKRDSVVYMKNGELFVAKQEEWGN